ncbi:MAG: hypothetical protein RL240_1823 [Planctomycetota bacterium]|jgi:hypothetical protein
MTRILLSVLLIASLCNDSLRAAPQFTSLESVAGTKPQSTQLNNPDSSGLQKVAFQTKDLSQPQASSDSQQFDNGNDPTIVRKRLTLKSEYMRFRNGLAVNTTTVQTSFPILQEESFKMNFGFDLPLNYYEVESPINTVLSGVGDMKAQLLAIVPRSEKLTFLLGSNLWLPTAEQQLLQLPDLGDYTDVDLGTGKFRFEPLIGAVYFINEKTFVIPLYAHDISFSGKPESPDINRGTTRIFVNRNLERGWYLSLETQFLVNYSNDNDLDAMQKFELGKAFKNGTVFYAKPGVGIAPGPFNRDWALELGLRFVF